MMTIPFSPQTYARPQFHGGDLRWAEIHFGHAAKTWLDLSTGINPNAYPVPEISQTAWQRLPGSELEDELLSAARAFYQLPKSADIVALPGTQSAIQLLPRLFPACAVDIISPTYSEHFQSWSRGGHDVQAIPLLKDIRAETEFAVLVHPNNPDGNVLSRDEILILARELRSCGGWLIVDEAFADTEPALSFAQDLDSNGFIILKSFGKFFGLAGLRLGFLLAPPSVTSQIREGLGPWAVSGIAMEVGKAALGDQNWIMSTRNKLTSASQRLRALLSLSGLQLAGSTSLFQLIESPHSEALFTHLCEAGILCRIFPDRPGYLRFGLPGTEKDWLRLKNALEQWSVPTPPSLSD